MAPADAAFLHLERPDLPQHVGTVMVFAPAPGTVAGPAMLDRVVRHVEGRIAFVPRYRRRLRWIPGGLADPVWVDDERFDLSYHVRLSALPRPGGQAELAEFVGRVSARPLDRTRPLWELYVIDGVALDPDGDAMGFAVVTKTHQAVVDGVQALDLAQVILDTSDDASSGPLAPWRPVPEPSGAELIATAVLGTVAHPVRAVRITRGRVRDLRRTARRVASSLVGLAVAPSASTGPLESSGSAHRRFVAVSTPLGPYQDIARHVASAITDNPQAPGTDPAGVIPTVNDVVLAVLTGALRQWLQERHQPPASGGSLRALIPVGVTRAGGEGGAATLVEHQIVDLPVGEANPLIRLSHIAYQLSSHREGGRAVSAPDLMNLAGFAPPTLHGMGARAAARLSRRFADLVVSNVPGPQAARYAAGATMTATYPVIPLSDGHGLSVGVTSYDGRVFVGLTADRDAMADLDDLGAAISVALAELGEVSG